MKDELLYAMLIEHGFKAHDIQITETHVIIDNFRRQIDTARLQPEGQPIPNKHDSNYHNYIYPNGLLPSLENLQVTKSQHRRIQTITFSSPPDVLNSGEAFEDFIERINLTYNTAHAVTREPSGTLLFTADTRTADAGKHLLKGLLNELTPRIAHVDDMGGPNYVSDLGRLAPFILTAAKEQAYKILMSFPSPLNLLTLKDTEQRTAPAALRIEKKLLHEELEKRAREQDLLTNRVREALDMKHRPWMAVDANFFQDYKGLLERNNPAALALQEAKTNKAPLYISTTNGAHAFALMFDFQTKTLYLANPLGDYSGFNEIIRHIQANTGCHNIIHAITYPIQRDGNVDFQNICTADSMVLATMLQEQAQRGEIGVGCLDGMPLQTAHYLTLNLRDRGSSALEPAPHVSQHRFFDRRDSEGRAQDIDFVSRLQELLAYATHAALDAWNQAYLLLDSYAGYAPITATEGLGQRVVTYEATRINPENGTEETIEKNVSEEAQIYLDEVYARMIEQSPENRQNLS
jgi:hypothetical protein